ncbi:hypothetical protein OUZ56_021652 [Daphnia magna]|uniref:Uncharacterized protein n=1 Tax=Daphnia magna TaxID=35525 RepID=A0ABR0AU52_9CRUS|nr:hypothetical protein OUZ56_021652 [Daphnia magna]
MDLNSHRSSSESSSSSSTSQLFSASDSSAEEKSKKKFNHRSNYLASPKSEMKCLMKKFSKKPALKIALKDEKDLLQKIFSASGLGLRCDVKFRCNGSPNNVFCVFKRTFPRLNEIDQFYICTKLQRLSRQLPMKHYTTPTAHLLKRGIQYDLSEEMVDIYEKNVPITLWSSHIDLCTEKRKTCQDKTVM